MNELFGVKLYLSGPIEYNSDLNWREEPKKILTERFGITVFDPFADPKQQWAASLKEAREKNDFETIVRISKSIVRKDLCMVDRADFVIAYLPENVRTTGTVHEIINSNAAKKPTLLVTDAKSISHIPIWYFGFIPCEFMFAGWNALYDYLAEVNDGKHKENNRWHYIYKLI